jgi:hypothetical protein
LPRSLDLALLNGFKAIRQLKPTFRDALGLALPVYPEARVDLEVIGVVPHPSGTPAS